MFKVKNLVWLAALTGSIFIGTSATVFSAIKSIDPYMKSAWRTQITCYCNLILVIYTYKSNKEKYLQFKQNFLKRSLLSGLILGINYSAWMLSLDLTSVAHSLLFLTSTPLLMVLYYMARRKPIQKSEMIGTLVGCAGMVIICIEKNSPEGATLLGDMMALIGSAAIGMHFILSENLTNEGGAYYIMIINAVAAVTCLFFSLINALAIYGAAGFEVILEFFAWLYTFDGLYAAYLGIFVGFIGNGCFYFMLQYTSPLVVTIVIFFEPITGSIFAWCFGYQAEPSIYTWVGGLIILIGNFIVGIFAKLKNVSPEKVGEDDRNDEEISGVLIENL